MLAQALTGNPTIVAHGTVISLYVVAKTGTEPFPLWRRLGLASFVVMVPAEERLASVVENVGSSNHAGYDHRAKHH